MDLSNQIIFFGALLIVVSILASAFSSRFGAPILLVFLVLGMLAGEDGPGGIRFNDFQIAYLVSTLALAVILFDGGMRANAESFRVALRPAVSLATVGVVITAAITGGFATWIFGLHWLHGLLIGAIVGSTDAAAVFALLHARGMELKQRVAATLEVESGSNDPMAVFLVVVLIEVLAAGHATLSWTVVLEFVKQMTIGAVAGLVAGRLLIWLINHLNLETGLYPLLAVAGGVMTYGATTVAGGSGFLAIYLAGVILGNSQLQAMQNIHRVNDGLAWLSQIMMFLLLGLLVTPSEFLPVALPALLVALALMVLARPVAVWVSLLPFRFSWREQLFISWVGLRGAVPIILASFPLLAGLEHGTVYFNVAFIVVLMSLVLQGWTIAPLARVLRLEVPPKVKPMQYIDLDIPGQFNHDLLGYQLESDSFAAGKSPAQLPLPQETEIAAVIRGTRVMNVNTLGALQAGDYVYVLAIPEHVETLNRMFGVVHGPDRLEEHRFFGDFILNGDARVADIETIYGLGLDYRNPDETLAAFLGRKFGGVPVVGDRLRAHGVELVVRAVEKGVVTRVGLKLHD
ncbi:MAG: K+/H+ antiporter [Betaproteobacteria bacterium RIFCSPLOWO2_12_FULL_62_13]|nr:MAG: K+/H+ antiporter [Betaproteobacteria bacterium RIFCSPLOWO2_12_FULL_62_13]